VFEDPAGLNYETDYTYDALDNLLTVNQKGASANSANWRARTFNYDSLSRLLTATNPESGTSSYTYDANGNLASKTSPAPNQTGSATVTLSYCYDALNRLTSKAYTAQSCPMSSPVATYLYDQTSYNGLTTANGIGRRTGMTDQAGSEAWSYDQMGRVAADLRSTIVPGTSNTLSKNMVYAYNVDGSLFTLTMPIDAVPRLHTLTYQQGGAGRYLSVSGYATNAHYTPGGARCYLQQGWDGLFTTTSSFNNRLQPATIYAIQQQGNSFTPPPVCTASSVIPNDGYTFNHLYLTYSFTDSNGHNNGNVASIANTLDGTRSQSFTYDSLNRIATAQTTSTNATSHANCWAETYTYDPWANLISLGANTSTQSAYIGCSQESGFNFTGGIGTNNRIAVSGYTYDSAGNIIADPPTGTSYTYDPENHLISTAGVNYTYDGDGRRVTKSSGMIYWYGTNSAALIESDFSLNLIYFYVFFNGQRVARNPSNNEVNFFLTDYLGNTRAMFTIAGSIWSDFYPFGGERVVSSGKPTNYKFTGKERDPESGNDNFGARYFTSNFGRFMSPDPENLDGLINQDDPQAWNGYAYARNNPLNITDPDGTNNHLVCQTVDTGGSGGTTGGAVPATHCADLTQGQYDQFRQDNPNLRVTPSGDIYAGNNKIGSQTEYNAADVQAAQILSGPVQNVVTKAGYIVGGAMAAVYAGAAYGTYQIGTTALNLAGAGGAAAPIIYKVGDVVQATIQTSEGPVRIVANVIQVSGKELTLNRLDMFESVSGAEINPGPGQLLRGIRPLLSQLKEAGFETVRILADRTTGKNSGMRDITIPLR
jgi:RHS repeat-associated protein